MLATLGNIVGNGLGLVIGFILGLIPLILVHEFGHLIMAKLMGVWAREFGIGYPPRIIKLFRWQETDFTLNWLPLGGFLRMEGEETFDNDEEESSTEPDPKVLAEREEAKNHTLYSKSPLQRILIYLGGPLMNLITAWIIAIIIYMSGMPAAPVSIQEIATNSPAEEVGMQVDDLILMINGEEVNSMEDVQTLIKESLDEDTEVVLERNGEQKTFSIVPRSNPPENEGSMGIRIGLAGWTRYSIGEALVKGTQYLGSTILQILVSFVAVPLLIIRGSLSWNLARPVGIIGISQVAQYSIQTSVSAGSLTPFLSMVMLISLSLGIFNLLPIPALDGGRIVFAFIEQLRKKALNPELEERIHMITLAIMMLLFLFITMLDIIAPVPLP